MPHGFRKREVSAIRLAGYVAFGGNNAALSEAAGLFRNQTYLGRICAMNTRSRFSIKIPYVALCAVLLLTVSCSTQNNEVSALKQQVEQMSNQMGVLEDTNAIRKLQHAYGYYLDKCLYKEVVDLFAEDGEAHFNGGIYKGRDKGVRRLYIDGFSKGFTGGKNGPAHGFLLEHFQIQDIVDVSPDRKTAKARFRCFMQAGAHKTSKSPMGEMARKQGGAPMQWWEGGMYENTYVRERGIWKIKVLNYHALWHADYATGWANTRLNYVSPASEIYPKNPNGPDELIKPAPTLWPETDVVPFHYAHPVTGEPWK
jgi:hypothetical protein